MLYHSSVDLIMGYHEHMERSIDAKFETEACMIIPTFILEIDKIEILLKHFVVPSLWLNTNNFIDCIYCCIK